MRSDRSHSNYNGAQVTGVENDRRLGNNALQHATLLDEDRRVCPVTGQVTSRLWVKKSRRA
jgi:hypothetical protein